jgi:hypothetical protein
VHDGVDRPIALPYVPALQLVQTPAPPTLNLPVPQMAAVPLVDPGTQKYPAVQLPVHAADGRPTVAPYVPAGQGAVHVAVLSAVVPPYRPALQLVHTPDLLTLYLPTGHGDAVGDVDPDTQKYPAVQLPLQPPVVMPNAAP